MKKKFETEKKWREWNALGLLPGQNETEKAFNDRVNLCLGLDQHLHEIVEQLPFKIDDKMGQKLLLEAFPCTKKLYGIEPTWVPIFFSNYQLAPWHGACAWIFQLAPNSPTTAFLQLRANFLRSKTYLKLYDRSELIAHELAHVGRMEYGESKFEEIFAYQTSSFVWQRWLGPIVQSAKESLMFIIFILVLFLIDFALLFAEVNIAYIWWIKLFPAMVVSYALLRLSRLHYYYKKCLGKLRSIYPEHISKHLLYRLTDNEIIQFAKLTPAAICEKISTARQSSFRWTFLAAIYSRSE